MKSHASVFSSLFFFSLMVLVPVPIRSASGGANTALALVTTHGLALVAGYQVGYQSGHQSGLAAASTAQAADPLQKAMRSLQAEQHSIVYAAAHYALDQVEKQQKQASVQAVAQGINAAAGLGIGSSATGAMPLLASAALARSSSNRAPDSLAVRHRRSASDDARQKTLLELASLTHGTRVIALADYLAQASSGLASKQQQADSPSARSTAVPRKDNTAGRRALQAALVQAGLVEQERSPRSLGAAANSAGQQELARTHLSLTSAQAYALAHPALAQIVADEQVQKLFAQGNQVDVRAVIQRMTGAH